MSLKSQTKHPESAWPTVTSRGQYSTVEAFAGGTISLLLMEENVMGWMRRQKFHHKGWINSLIHASGGKAGGHKIFFTLIIHANTRWSRVQKDETKLPSLLQPSSFTHRAERRGLAHTKARLSIKHPWEKTLARKQSYTEGGGGAELSARQPGKTRRVSSCHPWLVMTVTYTQHFLKSESKTSSRRSV